MSAIGAALAEAARLRGGVAQHSASRTDVRPPTKSTRSAEAVEAERRKTFSERVTKPCPSCFPMPTGAGANHGVYGTGFLTVDGVCSTDEDCPTCAGKGRVPFVVTAAALDKESAS